MQLSSTLSWLVDVAGEAAGPDRLLAEIGARLVADGLPLAGGALTLAVPHPLIARRTWLWRADRGEVIEAFGFAAEDSGPPARPPPAIPGRAGSLVWPPGPCPVTPAGRGRPRLPPAAAVRAPSRHSL